MLKNTILSIVVVGVLLTAIELALRLSGASGIASKQLLDFVPRRTNPPYRQNEALGWDLLPNWEGEVKGVRVTTNSFGMRDDEFPLVKPDGAIRLLAVGDSFTFGFGVEQDNSYVEILEDLLNTTHPDMRSSVLNGGVGGYNTEQEKIWLGERGMSFEPDIVLVGFVLNDVMFRGIYLPENQPRLVQLLSRTAIYNVLNRAILSHRARPDAYERAKDITARLLEDSDKTDELWQECFHHIEGMKEITSAAGIPLVFVLFPWPNQLTEDPGVRTPQDRLIQYLNSQGIGHIDLIPAMREAKDGLYVEGDTHPSARGHEIAAREILAYLDARFLSNEPDDAN